MRIQLQNTTEQTMNRISRADARTGGLLEFDASMYVFDDEGRPLISNDRWRQWLEHQQGYYMSDSEEDQLATLSKMVAQGFHADSLLKECIRTRRDGFTNPPRYCVPAHLRAEYGYD
jgi:hypothetical protein